MGKLIGILLVLGGVAGYLYSWLRMKREKQLRVKEFILFLYRSIFAMQTEKVRLIDYFAKYVSQDSRITETLHEVARRLSMNIYQKGELAWEEVLKEEEQNWALNDETFQVILHTGSGFFGRSCEENICFLQKSISDLEKQQKKIKEKDAQERRVWIPVGMLGAIMLTILFI